MKTLLLFLGLIFLMGSLSLTADEPNFSVTIVGYRQVQEHYFKNALANHDQGCPLITIPEKSAANAELGEDKPTGNHFYVLATNLSKTSIRLNLASSSWYDCLRFKLGAPDGTIFQIHRPPTPWSANPIESWIWQPNATRVFTIDFTSGRWEGLPIPSETHSRSHFKPRASFTYYDWDQKKNSIFNSDDIDAQNGL